MKDLIEKAKKCNNCLCWLPVCHAECCKIFVIRKAKQFKLKPVKGKVFSFPVCLNEDLVKYFELHNCNYVQGFLHVFVEGFTWDGDDLSIHNKCSNLGEDFKCKNYENRPLICKDLNIDTMDDPKFVITPNCLFRYKKNGKL